MSRKSPQKLDYRLARYALVTGAALASLKPAKAGVIATYLLTPVPLDSSGEQYSLDINNDGIADYLFTALLPGDTYSAGQIRGYCVSAVTGSGASFAGFNMIAQGGSGIALAYTLGALIGALPTFSNSFDLTALGSSSALGVYGTVANLGGAFTDSGTFFVGLNFTDQSGIGHYGFVEFDPMQIIGYAYQSDANTPIVTFDLASAATPEPGSLALLAIGAAGLAALRKRRT